MLSVLIHSVIALVAAVVVLLGPGLLCTRALRLRGLPALASATGLTCTIVGAAATLTTHGVTSLRWTLPLLIAATAVSALVAYGIGRLLPAPPARDGRTLRRAAAIGTGVGTLSLGLALFLSIRRLDAVVAQPDANYHLNSIRSILLGGDASSLDGGVFLYDRPHSYYPSTFHAIAASASQLTGLQPVFVANAVSMICGSLIWTLGCVLLCRQAFGRNGAALIAGGVAASTFVAMPFWISGYGPLWPLVLGYAVLPGLIACLLSLFRLARRDTIGRPQAAVLLVTTVAGLLFVHPAAFSAIVLIAYPLLVMATVRSHRKSLAPSSRADDHGGDAQCAGAVVGRDPDPADPRFHRAVRRDRLRANPARRLRDPHQPARRFGRAVGDLDRHRHRALGVPPTTAACGGRWLPGWSSSWHSSPSRPSSPD